MSLAYTPKDAAIDLVAVALILAPEPASTAIGISMLLRKRGSVAQGESTQPRMIYPEYQYRVDNIRGRNITWEVRTTMAGQLPLREVNKPSVKIKPREQYFYSPQTAPDTKQSTPVKLPPGAKVHHEIYRPAAAPLAKRTDFIPGETIHHTLRDRIPAGSLVKREQPDAHIHHTIENSPGYIRAQSTGDPARGPEIIHHTIKDSPASQHGNPANIVKPVRIIEHHELNKTPPLKINGRLIKPPAPPTRKSNLPGRINNPDR